ncbi:hypothetical protein LTR95_004997 [Oleoguttula sp. CCFEE 5521]
MPDLPLGLMPFIKRLQSPSPSTTSSRHPSELPPSPLAPSTIDEHLGRMPLTLAKLTKELHARHCIPEASDARSCFEAIQSGDVAGAEAALCCAEFCCEILEDEDEGTGVSEAVRARAHGMLARREMGEDVASRWVHACEAMKLWGIVIARTGVSKFPVEKARVEREEATDVFLQAVCDWHTARARYLASKAGAPRS